MFAGKFVNSERFLPALREHIRLRFIKWVRFFERNWNVKWVILFVSFCWLWDFLLENLKLKKLWWFPQELSTNIKTLYAQNNIFKKKNLKYGILKFIFWSNFRFLGTALGRFNQCFFFKFSLSANYGDGNFCSATRLPLLPPHYKKASYGPDMSQCCITVSPSSYHLKVLGLH